MEKTKANNKIHNKAKGDAGEDLACKFLEAQGFEIYARNFVCQYGEIDIIATRNDEIHFVEVKSRGTDYVPGRVAVNAGKQKHIRKVAKYFLTINGLMYKHICVFDVIEITAGVVEFLENCFY